MDLNLVIIAFAAIAGGIVSGILGWMESDEDFNPRKFGGTLIRSCIAGIGFAVAYKFSNGMTAMDVFYAFLGGAGFDVVVNRAGGKFGNSSFPLS